MKGEKYLQSRIAQIDRRSPALVSKLMVRIMIVLALVVGFSFTCGGTVSYLVDNPWFDKSEGEKLKEPYLQTIERSHQYAKQTEDEWGRTVNPKNHCSDEVYNWVQNNQEHLTWRNLKKISEAVNFPDSNQKIYLQRLIK